MSKRNIIILAIVVVLVGAGLGYYFLYYTEEPEQLTQDATQVTQQTGEDGETESEEGTGDSEELVKPITEEDLEVTLDEKYAYRQELRDPFGNVQQQAPVIQEEDLTIPFRLDGIISNGNQNIAVISTSEGPRFISNNESIGDYHISNVGNEQIRIRYKYLTVYMKIGGALVE
jgi:type II secretory pathway component PulC